MPYIGRSTEAFGVRSRFTYLASASDTSVSGPDVNGLTLSFTDGAYVDVFLNGVRLKHGTDYVTTTANTIGSLSALAANDEVEIVVFDVFSLADMVSSANGGNFSSQVNFNTDSAVVAFGADNDITLTHSADTGLILKNTSTTGNSGVGAVLTLQTGDTDIAQGNTLGRIDFQAPDEGTGTDAVLVAASIRARAGAAFSSSVNTTSLEFMTGASEAATRKMSVTANGNVDIFTDGASIEFGADSEIQLTHSADTGLILKHTATADDKPVVLTLQTGETDIAQDDVLGTINFQAPDEGTGTDAILVAAGIEAVSEGDFSSSSNATKLSFKTGASEAASEKMSLSSAGNLTVSGDVSVGDDLSLASDSAVLKFGADADVTLTHVADEGLTLKSTATDGASGLGPVLNLSTGDTDIAAGNQLGTINFQAPNEGTGTDAILVGASIVAMAQADFSSSVNSTSLLMRTGTSGTNDGGYFEIRPDGDVNIRNQNSADDSFPTLTLQTGDTDIAQSDVLGKISFQAPLEGAGTDAVLAGASIQAVSEGDFSSSSNATSIEFMTGSSEAAAAKMRLTSSGALIIDNSGNVKTKVDGVNDDNEGVKGSGAQLQLHGASPVLDVFSYSTTNGTHGGINFMKSRNNTVGTNTTITTGDVIGSIQFGGFDGVDYASIMGKIDFQAGGAGMAENDTAGEMVFYTSADGSGGNGSSERMRIQSTGKITVGDELSVGFSGGSTRAAIMDGSATQGSAIAGQDSGFAVNGQFVLECNRTGSDGDVVLIKQAGTSEGSISVSGSTVSYNAFTGSHWSRLTDNSKPTILRGTIIETIDEMCDWYHLEFTYPEVKYKEGDTDIPNDKKVGDVRQPANTVKKPYEKPSNVNVGDTVQWTDKDDGNKVYDATVTLTKDVKHVKCKVSDTSDCTNVYGVFLDWDNDDDTVNDMYVNAVGTSLVRIHKDQTVAKGDLLVSNGDGTAKKQGDDIIRSKTIGKVLTNIKQETYSDSSYTVPCAIYCG